MSEFWHNIEDCPLSVFRKVNLFNDYKALLISGEFDIDSMNTWQSMDNFLQEPPKLLDDPEDFSQDFF